MAWKQGASSSVEKPLEFDDVSSSSTIYLRRNIEKVHHTDESNGAEYDLWEYEEQQIDKTDWSMYQEVIQAQTDITDANGGLLDLAEIISAHEEKIAQLEVAAQSN